MGMNYGKEIILDLHDCKINPATKYSIREFVFRLCDKIKMIREDLHFWEYEDPEEYDKAPDHLKGVSAVQFIRTSNITIHVLDKLERVYLNVFSCKDFDSDLVRSFSEEYFGGRTVNFKEVERI